MKLEYKHLIGFYCVYKDTHNRLRSIDIDDNRISFNDTSPFKEELIKDFIHNIFLKFDILYIDHSNHRITLPSDELINKIKSYYLYNKRKNIIENL